MQSNPAKCLTAMCLTMLALLLAPAMASAAEVSAARSSGQAMMSADGNSSSGLSALQSSNAGSSVHGSAGDVSAVRSSSEGLARPSGSSWSDGLQSLAAVQPSALMASKGAESAMMPPQGAATDINGVEAIRRAAPSSQPRATVESLQSTIGAGANLYERSPR
jgi:hypothetical protein